MKRLLPYLLIMMSFIVFLPIMGILGIYAGWTVGTSIDDRKTAEQYNKPWEKLDGPYRFVEIVDATRDTLWAQAKDGHLYYWSFYCSDASVNCLEWVETQTVPADIHNENLGDLPFEKDQICPRLSSFPKEQPPLMVECAYGGYQSSVLFGRYYALLTDGTIWQWETPVGNDGPGSGYFGAIFGCFTGLLVGALIWVPIAIFLGIRERKKARNVFSA